LSIRVLQESDVLLYQELRLSSLKLNPEAFCSTYEREAGFSLDVVVERITPSQDKFVLGAFDQSGSLLGIVTFMREVSLKSTHKGNVYGMYVAPKVRGCGVGKSLMLELIRRAKVCEGLEQINLSVISNNDPARKLYESLGFQLYGVERNALKSNGQYYDEEFMVLKLN